MRTTVFLAVLAALAFVAARSVPKKGCFSTCFGRIIKRDNFTELKPCFLDCFRNITKNLAKDDTVVMLKKIPEALPLLQNIGIIQGNVSTLQDVEAEADSESYAPKSGAHLEATDSLNIRGQACTGGKLITTVAVGTKMTYTNNAVTACGYTWYSVSGSFGNGWAASNYLREVTSGKFPLFKQCDSKWGNDHLGSSTVCRIGCLMSSVAMALNGLGRSIDGHTSTPGVLNKYLSTHHGYQGNLFLWGSVSKFGFGYVGQFRDKNQLRNYFKQGKVLILNVRNGGHWVLCTGLGNGYFSVNDPGFNVAKYTDAQVVLAGVYKV
jgi:hypothetical protein